MNTFELIMVSVTVLIAVLWILILVALISQMKFQARIIQLIRWMLWDNGIAAANIEKKLTQISWNTYFLTDKKHEPKKYSD